MRCSDSIVLTYRIARRKENAKQLIPDKSDV